MNAIRSDFRFLERLRVRWAEVDLQGIVFNAHYLTYFDTAVAGYWRALALPYQATMERLQGDLYVRKASVEYEASARYDEQLEVGIRCARVGKSSLRFDAAVFRGAQRLVHGELIYVFADPPTQQSRPVPAVLRSLLEDFEGGRGVFDVTLGGWEELGAAARSLRQAVFVEEEKASAAAVADAQDAGAVHAVARNRLGMPVAAGRLLAHGQGVARIGRMAALASVRGAGLGRAVLEALLAAARQRGEHEVLLHANATAVPFYERAGFRRSGAVFEEAGLPHQEMRCTL